MPTENTTAYMNTSKTPAKLNNGWLIMRMPGAKNSSGIDY